MSDALRITNVRFMAGSKAAARTGLMGWISCDLCGLLRLDGLTLRRTSDNRYAISFPARRDAAGKRHFLVRPIDDDARREIEYLIFRSLSLKEGMRR